MEYTQLSTGNVSLDSKIPKYVQFSKFNLLFGSTIYNNDGDRNTTPLSPCSNLLNGF